jgi:hypothetical protein
MKCVRQPAFFDRFRVGAPLKPRLKLLATPVVAWWATVEGLERSLTVMTLIVQLTVLMYVSIGMFAIVQFIIFGERLRMSRHIFRQAAINYHSFN